MCVCDSGGPRSDHMEAYWQWCSGKNLAQHNDFPVTFKRSNDADGYGAYATRPLQSRDPLFTVHKSVLIDRAAVFASLPFDASSLKFSDDNGLWALFLLYHRGRPDSSYYPYVRTLSSYFGEHVRTWGGSNLDNFQNVDNLAETVKTLRHQALDDFKSVKAQLGEEGCSHFSRTLFTARQYVAMLAHTHARMWNMAGLRGILPCADMFNHRTHHGNVHVADNEFIQILAYKPGGREIAMGEEVFMSYGNKPNRDMMLSYGFFVNSQTVEDNVRLLPDGSPVMVPSPHNTVQLSFGKALDKLSRCTLVANKAIASMFDVSIDLSRGTDALLPLERLCRVELLCKHEEKSNQDRSIEVPSMTIERLMKDHPLSPSHESEVKRNARDILQLLTLSWDTDPPKDEALLQSCKKHKECLAISYRLHTKRLIQEALRLANKKIEYHQRDNLDCKDIL
eukprot:CAMPEP_0177632270 /NCGR_PEP_ID=MMETSP0447-20121125/2199_1 /TAXON_ID=0 /ORGANISM="Stygamoeba regulata, Strain BSH-02190019" /LENGTH=450 /DNA_ID=CAMNT_0019133821 /DNA_START=335 /DNA_END=1687 /DNA_ORIENTATION=+